MVEGPHRATAFCFQPSLGFTVQSAPKYIVKASTERSRTCVFSPAEWHFRLLCPSLSRLWFCFTLRPICILCSGCLKLQGVVMQGKPPQVPRLQKVCRHETGHVKENKWFGQLTLIDIHEFEKTSFSPSHPIAGCWLCLAYIEFRYALKLFDGAELWHLW